MSGYPTIKFFPAGSDEAEDYEGGRSEADFVQFLNEKCGTQRAVGGGLSDEVSAVDTSVYCHSIVDTAPAGWPSSTI